MASSSTICCLMFSRASIMRNANDWYKRSQYNLSVGVFVGYLCSVTDANAQHDVHLCAYSALLRIVGKFHDEIFSDPSTPTGLNKVCTHPMS